MKTLVVTHQIPGQSAVSVYQTKVALNAEFTVQYGAQVREGMWFSEAFAEFGRCVAHAAECAGKVDFGGVV